MDAVIKLISSGSVQRADGTWTAGKTARDVFARVQSVSGYEFFGAGREGINPSLRFDVFSAEYQGETVVEYAGKRYSVYRTHQSDANSYITANLRGRQELTADYIQLYVQREGGTIGGNSDADA